MAAPAAVPGSVGLRLKRQPSLNALDLRRQPAVQAQVDVGAGVHAHGAAGTGERAEARRVGRRPSGAKRHRTMRRWLDRASRRSGRAVVQLWMKFTRSVLKAGSWNTTLPVSRTSRLPNISPLRS